MTTLVIEQDIFAESACFSEDSLTVRLDDGRALSVPLAWYPRLLHGTKAERENYELIGDGEGIHWPALNEDISIEGLLSGHPSGESQESFKRWLDSRSPRRSNKRMQPTGGCPVRC